MKRTQRLFAAAAVSVGLVVAAGCGSSSTTDSTATTASAKASVTVADPWARTSPAGVTMGAAYMTLTSNNGDTLTKVSVPSSVAAKAEIHETVMGGTTGTTSMSGTTMKPGTTMKTGTTMGGSTTSMKTKAFAGTTAAADHDHDNGSGGTIAAEDHDKTTGTGTTGTTMPAGSGEMQMKPVSSLPLPAGQAVQLKPGGYHIMLIDLAAPLKAGSTIQITLTFEKAGEQTVTATVRDA